MGKQSSDIVGTLGLVLILVVCLAITPNVLSSSVDAKYVAFTESQEIVPSVSNSTAALTYAARNTSSTYAYFGIVLNATDAYGLTTVDCSQNITYTEATKIIAFDSGVLNKTVVYLATISYQYIAISSAMATLLDLIPLFWVVAILACLIAFVTKKLNVW